MTGNQDMRIQGMLPEHWASVAAGRPAVIDGDDVLTYGEWNDLANRLAASLHALKPTSRRACVRMHARREWFIINLALEKLGREHVSMNWRLTPHEVREILLDSGPGIFFFDDQHPDPLIAECADLGIPFVSVGIAVSGALEFGPLLARPNPKSRSSSKRKSLITYTSGTTGRPKGVTRRPPADAEGQARATEWTWANTPVHHGHDYRALLSLPLHHGAGPRAAKVCHRAGGTVYLLDPFDPVRALEIIDRERITNWKVVPTMLHRIRALPAEQLKLFDVSSLRSLSLGAAPVPQALREWAVGYFGRVLHEGYGTSETGMVATLTPAMRPREPGSCGRLRPHAEVRVTGPDGREVPRGTEGELLIRTPMTITGYLGQGPLPSDLLTEDQFFRTGDIGRLDEDDFLYITGRTKDMIIAGGVNIFPAEIEHVLTEHPAVLDAAVIGVPEETFGEQVMAFCETREGAEVTQSELAEFVSGRLAPFKRPRRIEFVSELPRNDTGKILKQELRAPFWTNRELKI
jgi:long-chain acyl-CoA synthetase